MLHPGCVSSALQLSGVQCKVPQGKEMGRLYQLYSAIQFFFILSLFVEYIFYVSICSYYISLFTHIKFLEIPALFQNTFVFPRSYERIARKLVTTIAKLEGHRLCAPKGNCLFMKLFTIMSSDASFTQIKTYLH